MFNKCTAGLFIETNISIAADYKKYIQYILSEPQENSTRDLVSAAFRNRHVFLSLNFHASCQNLGQQFEAVRKRWVGLCSGKTHCRFKYPNICRLFTALRGFVPMQPERDENITGQWFSSAVT